MVIDDLGRTFKKLRVSLTDVCDFACVYCVDEDHTNQKVDITPPSVIVKYIASIHRSTPIEKIVFTGGEPLLYPFLDKLIRSVKELGIATVSITTNGFLLKRKLKNLVEAGLDAVNVSLDAIDADVFEKITRREKIADVLETIVRCKEYGVVTKINAVIMKGLNENEILPLIEFGRRKDVPVRFLELMQMGYLKNSAEAHRYTQDEILLRISEYYPIHKELRTKSSTANYWQLPDGYRFGIIANESAPFCGDCDRLRLDYKGNIYGCLSSNYKINISGELSDVEMNTALKNAIAFKKTHQFSGNEFSMKSIGG